MIRKEKSEIRNPKSETNPKFQAGMTETLTPLGGSVLNFGLWTFEFVSDFVLRISDFGLPAGSQEVL